MDALKTDSLPVMPPAPLVAPALSLDQGNSDFYRALVENSADAIFINCDGRIVYCNPATLRLLGATRMDEVIGKQASDFVHPASQAAVEGRLAHHAQQREFPHPLVHRCMQLNGTVVDVEATGAPAVWQGRPAAQIVARDLTARRALQAELQESRRLFGHMAATVPGILYVFDLAERRNVYTSEGITAILGYPADVLDGTTGKQLAEMLHPDEAVEVLAYVQNFANLADGEVADHEYRMRHANGIYRWLYCRDTVFDRHADGSVRRILGVAIDVTKRREAEECLRRTHDELEQRVEVRTAQLVATNSELEREITRRRALEQTRQSLLNRLVNAQEEERRRISRELHDQMGQGLAALKMGLRGLPARLNFDACSENQTQLNEALQTLLGLTAVLMDQVHRLAWDLRPATLDNIGLEAALRQHVGEWAQANGMEAEFFCQGLPEGLRLPPEMETALYRAVQEALLNAQKHSNASRADVLLESRGASLTAIIEDNGCGFDAETLLQNLAEGATPDRLGLLGIKERLESVGGTLDIESAIGHGTTLFLRVPLPEQSA